MLEFAEGGAQRETIQLIDGSMEEEDSLLIYCYCSSHYQSAPTRSQANSPGVDPPWYANYHSIYMRSAKLCLGVVVGIAVGAAFYSLGRKLVVDKTMRLNRQNRGE
ncbi:hypothetical protein LHYA1_G000118 [Lachnellula hyalina]|uniref:Uncharacterized protein n=1 Tax=Lachnellula hyalina TaxID=1316788 RepID=A0A8H8R9V1_9HELO|nr:uncharacterized protein LHYA1_G000118 [Lachnellula hyalina]TVY31071.1 hypothetical protein LHYA1_G000118 [Lachnellula hyalina]